MIKLIVFWIAIAVTMSFLLIHLSDNVEAQTTVSGPIIDPRKDIRMRGCVVRDADGSIHRNHTIEKLFEKLYTLPAGELRVNWQVDHSVPLICGGWDAVFNMQWLPKAIKTCSAKSGIPCKDRFEQKVYCPNGPAPTCPAL